MRDHLHERVERRWHGRDDDAYERARRRVRVLRGFYKHLAIYGVFCTGLIVAGLVTGQWKRGWFAPPIFWGVGVSIHALMVFGGAFWLGREWEERKIAEFMAKEQIRTLSTEKQLAQAQLRLLQAQIEPHFLFNTLANVVSLIETAPTKASAMLERFIAYLRASLAASRSTEGTLGQEIELLRNYLEILRIRMGERLVYAIDAPTELLAQPLAPMLLQPVVENAVKHGLEPKVEGGRVELRAWREGARLMVRVSDDGLGFAPGSGSGVGLANLRERLQVLYDGQAQLRIEALSPGTAVTVELPITAASVP